MSRGASNTLSWERSGSQRGSFPNGNWRETAFRKLAKALSRMDERDRKLLLGMAGNGATRCKAVAVSERRCGNPNEDEK